jgi:DNA replication and repair protein RecF
VKSFFVIDAEFIKNERNEQVVCSLKKVKSIKAQWQSLRQIFRPCRFYSLGIISPADRDLIVEGSETRRKFMDSVISQLDSQYLQHLIQYQKVLNQRNALLKYFALNRVLKTTSPFIMNNLMVW